jgi:hypothetical protein
METIKVTHVYGHAFNGPFLGTLLTALSISSSIKHGHNSAELMYFADASVSSLSRPLAIIMRSRMIEGG